MSLKNYAFIEGQNLHIGTIENKDPWKVDFKRFRIYLKEKHNVEYAFYYIGCLDENYQNLYEKIQMAGFVICFREHKSSMYGMKKGNVDSDIVFDVMKKLYKQEEFSKVLLVSGDGDYVKLVKFFDY